MLHHVSVGVSDVERAAKFYDAVLKALGYKRVVEYLPYAVGYGERGGSPQFWIGLPHNQQVPSSGNGTHVGFSASSKGQVNKFHEAALAQGGSNNGERARVPITARLTTAPSSTISTATRSRRRSSRPRSRRPSRRRRRNPPRGTGRTGRPSRRARKRRKKKARRR